MVLKHEHLIGREYVPGEVHCYTLVRDLYRDNFGIELPDFALPPIWDPNLINIIDMVTTRLGVDRVENWTLKTLRPGDVLALAVQSTNPNHLGTYLGEGQFMHHPYNKRASVEPMRDFWRMATCYVIRHPEVPDLTPVKPSSTVEEILSARYNRIFEA